MLVMNTSKMEGQAFAKKKLKKRVTDLCKIEEKQIFSIFLQLLKKKLRRCTNNDCMLCKYPN